MLFQGQEFLQGDWFQDTVPLDWDQSETFRGIVRLYRDLIRLRLNRGGVTRGLTGHGMAVHRIDRSASSSPSAAGTRAVPATTSWWSRTSATRHAGSTGSASAGGALEAPPQHRLDRLQRGFRRPRQQ